MSDFAYQFPYTYPINGCFIVKNIITNSNKTIRIFDYPIPVGQTRDLLKIPGVSESSIRASLLKGTLRNKLFAGEIYIVCSDVDLLQFNNVQKQFLQNAGVEKGLAIDINQLTNIRKEDIKLVGIVNGINVMFTIPFGKFIQDDDHKIIVYKNGVKQAFLDDYIIFESEGPGTGYDGVALMIPPTIDPPPDDVITADYYISN